MSARDAGLQRRRAAYRAGRIAEFVAAALLLVKGYRLIAWRHKTPVGEIDLIARRGNTTIFVEVKARAAHSDAAEAVTGRQRRRIVRAARHYIAGASEAAGRQYRFDVVLIARFSLPRHIRHAFEADRDGGGW